MEEKTMFNVVKELEERGYTAKVVSVVKNGITMFGVSIGDGDVRPTFYPYQQIEAGKTMDEVVDSIVSNLKKQAPINIEKAISWDYAKDNLWVCIQKKSQEDILKKDFLDLEMYVRVRITDDIFSGGGCKHRVL